TRGHGGSEPHAGSGMRQVHPSTVPVGPKSVAAWAAALLHSPRYLMSTKKYGPVLLILFAALMAGAGNGISLIAFPWLVLQRNGSALDASIVAMAGTLPLLVATLIAGAAVDYLGRRWVSMISDGLSALAVIAVPI